MINTFRFVRSKFPFCDSGNGNTLLLLGSGRSGTTWLTETVAKALQSRIIFEPLKRYPGLKSGESLFRPYVPENQVDKSLFSFYDNVFTGRYRSRWSDRYNNRFFYHSRIVKDINANLLFPWLLASFSTIKIAYVFRHPLAVVASQVKGGWTLSSDVFTSQPSLMEDYLSCFKPAIPLASSRLQKAILFWFLENYMALKCSCDDLYLTRFRVFSYDSLRSSSAYFSNFLLFSGLNMSDIESVDSSIPSRVSRGKKCFEYSSTSSIYSQEDLSFLLYLLELACFPVFVNSIILDLISGSTSQE